jgi:hypothetical protein
MDRHRTRPRLVSFMSCSLAPEAPVLVDVPELPPRPVQRVTQQRVPGLRQVHPDLVRPARQQIHLHQRSALEVLPRPVHRDCRLALPHLPRELLPVHRVSPVQRLDPRLRLRVPMHQRQVRLLHRPRLERLLQRHQRLLVLRHDEAPRRVLVQPVHDPRPQFPTHARQILHPVQQRVHQRPRCVPRPRVHHHPRRLVHHHQVLVLVQHLQRQFLGHRNGRHGRGDL